MTIKIRPFRKLESRAVYEMLQTITREENEATNKVGGITFDEFKEFCKNAVQRAKGQKLPEGHIPQITYLIFDEDIPVGFGKFRPIMNELCIKNRAFHFSYMIAPKHRGKGYATAFIAFIKKKALKRGLTEIRGTALIENMASRRGMEKNGGILESAYDNGATYVIPLKKER